VKLENPQLHMIIVAPPEVGAGTEAAIESLQSDNNVHFTGFMPDPVPAYAAMNCLVLPSYSEGFGCVLLEAACFELPAVATNVPGCTDAVVENHTGWLVEARDDKSLAEAMQRTYGEPDVARKLGENARIRAVAEFGQELIWSGYAELYGVLSGLPKSKWRSMLSSSSVLSEHLR
jgi:glycosyltransferase involved in cell wall biosynthesis